MSNTTRICFSTRLQNSTSQSPAPRKAWKDDSQKQFLHVGFLKAAENEKLNLVGTLPEQPGPRSVPDSIGAPAERRKGGPQEEFIDVDPNFTEDMPKEEKEELLKRARKENKKEN